jgi:hypothetical protein
MTASRTVTKPAAALQLGDRIVTRIPGHAVFFDLVTGLAIEDDGRVRVQCNHLNGWTYFLPSDEVRVLPPGRGFLSCKGVQ